MAAFSLIGIACAAPAYGQLIYDIPTDIARDVKRRQCWPKPFVCPDRQAVRAPFVVMVANGWQRQTTLSDYYHFDPTNGQLTEAGRLKVQWILTEAPECHRAVFVHNSLSPQETAARLKAVQELAFQIVPPGTMPVVLLTDVAPQGWPAAWVESVGEKFQKTIPDPRLPKAEAAPNTGGK
jgi:hypothetical protein